MVTVLILDRLRRLQGRVLNELITLWIRTGIKTGR